MGSRQGFYRRRLQGTSVCSLVGQVSVNSEIRPFWGLPLRVLYLGLKKRGLNNYRYYFGGSLV